MQGTAPTLSSQRGDLSHRPGHRVPDRDTWHRGSPGHIPPGMKLIAGSEVSLGAPDPASPPEMEVHGMVCMFQDVEYIRFFCTFLLQGRPGRGGNRHLREILVKTGSSLPGVRHLSHLQIATTRTLDSGQNFRDFKVSNEFVFSYLPVAVPPRPRCNSGSA